MSCERQILATGRVRYETFEVGTSNRQNDAACRRSSVDDQPGAAIDSKQVRLARRGRSDDWRFVNMPPQVGTLEIPLQNSVRSTPTITTSHERSP